MTATTNGHGAAANGDAIVPPSAELADAEALEKMRTRSLRAAEIRQEKKYDGRLTHELLMALQTMLEESTPRQYIKETPPTEGKPFPSTGVNSAQYQIDYLNSVFGLAHWRWLVHYEDAGQVARVHVVVGNNLIGIKLTDSGELDIPDDAEVLVVRDGWGGHSRGRGKGDVLKGSETNTLKRVLARIGPGSDVYRLDVESELTGEGPAYQHQQRQPNRNGSAATTTSTAASAITERQVGMIRAKARSRGLPASQVANLLRHVAGAPPFAFASENDAEAVLTDKLPKLPRNLKDPLVNAIEAVTPLATVAAPATPVAQAPAMTPPVATPSEQAPVAPVAAQAAPAGDGFVGFDPTAVVG